MERLANFSYEMQERRSNVKVEEERDERWFVKVWLFNILCQLHDPCSQTLSRILCICLFREVAFGCLLAVEAYRRSYE